MKRFITIIFLSTLTIAHGDNSVRFPPPSHVDTQIISRVEQLLDTIVIQHFSVTNMPLGDVLLLLTEKTEELDKPCSYVLNSGPSPSHDISLSAKLISIDRHNVTYPELLDDICRQSDLMWQISPITIIAPREHFERMKNDNPVQQSGPAYPPQSVGSADP
jgi:hypothetical protein